ncbi:hypothetical protein V8E53_000834 [Lactarius tabidus]
MGGHDKARLNGDSEMGITANATTRANYPRRNFSVGSGTEKEVLETPKLGSVRSRTSTLSDTQEAHPPRETMRQLFRNRERYVAERSRMVMVIGSSAGPNSWHSSLSTELSAVSPAWGNSVDASHWHWGVQASSDHGHPSPHVSSSPSYGLSSSPQSNLEQWLSSPLLGSARPHYERMSPCPRPHTIASHLSLSPSSPGSLSDFSTSVNSQQWRSAAIAESETSPEVTSSVETDPASTSIQQDRNTVAEEPNFCHLCCIIFTQLPDFRRHLKNKHEDKESSSPIEKLNQLLISGPSIPSSRQLSAVQEIHYESLGWEIFRDREQKALGGRRRSVRTNTTTVTLAVPILFSHYIKIMALTQNRLKYNNASLPLSVFPAQYSVAVRKLNFGIFSARYYACDDSLFITSEIKN